MQQLAVLAALNGLVVTVLVIAVLSVRQEVKGLKDAAEKNNEELVGVKSIVEKNKENEEAFRKEVKETISKEFLAMAFRGIRYWK